MWKKVLSGVLAFVPPIYIVLNGIGLTLNQIASAHRPEEPRVWLVPASISVVLLVILFGQISYYAAMVSKSKHLEQDIKVRWIFGLLFFSFFVIPISWFKLVWRAPKHDELAQTFE